MSCRAKAALLSGREGDRLELLAAEEIPLEGEIETRQGSMQIGKNADCEKSQLPLTAVHKWIYIK